MLYFQAHPGLSIQDASNNLLLMLSAKFLTPVTVAIFVAGLVAALMSSASGAVLAASSLIGYNGYRLLSRNPSDTTTLWLTRLVIPLFTGASLLLALEFKTIYHLMVISWTVLLVSLFASYVAAFFWRRANETGAITAYVGGIAAWIAAYFWYLPITEVANTNVVPGVEGVYFDWAMWDALYIASVWGLASSVVCLVVVSLATQQLNAPKPLADNDGRPMSNAGWFGLGSFTRAKNQPAYSNRHLKAT